MFWYELTLWLLVSFIVILEVLYEPSHFSLNLIFAPSTRAIGRLAGVCRRGASRCRAFLSFISSLYYSSIPVVSTVLSLFCPVAQSQFTKGHTLRSAASPKRIKTRHPTVYVAFSTSRSLPHPPSPYTHEMNLGNWAHTAHARSPLILDCRGPQTRRKIFVWPMKIMARSKATRVWYSVCIIGCIFEIVYLEWPSIHAPLLYAIGLAPLSRTSLCYPVTHRAHRFTHELFSQEFLLEIIQGCSWIWYFKALHFYQNNTESRVNSKTHCRFITLKTPNEYRILIGQGFATFFGSLPENCCDHNVCNT